MHCILLWLCALIRCVKSALIQENSLHNHDLRPFPDNTQLEDGRNGERPPLTSFSVSTEDLVQNSYGDHFQVIGQSGVPAMAAVLVPNGNVVFLDKIENYTQLSLENGQYAYSAEYNLTTNTARGLTCRTNAFCSGGSFLADGRVISVGGNGPLSHIDPTVGDGFRSIRYLERGMDDSNRNDDGWYESGHRLSTPRWYPSVQIMPDESIFVASGSLNGLDPAREENNNPTFEILDQAGRPISHNIRLSILERNQPYYMYPFLHLLKDGRLFIFVSRSAEIYDVDRQNTTRQLPDLPGAHRTYPNTGGSVLLPLTKDTNWEPDIIVCGGGAYADITSPSEQTCGRIQPLSADPVWHMEKMPEGRVMVEGVLLPDGKILWLNGARRGAQGFGIAKDPCFDALLYDPDKPRGHRWKTAGFSWVPRLYHSVALLLLDGTVMVAGSNPMEQPMLEPDFSSPATTYVTEFRVEIYMPPYFDGENAFKRPRDIWISQKNLTADGTSFVIAFTGSEDAKHLKIGLYHGGFVTHSLHMGQRLIFLEFDYFVPGLKYQIVKVSMPHSRSIVPPGPYVIYVVLDGVPGVGQFVMVS
jgi:Glyoxal oxidase N-terminus/Domain of unknown function (DUF1929)